MFFSQVVTWAIIVVTATVLHGNGVTTVRTAADAAQALQPLVHTFPNTGYIAKVLFALGIIGLGQGIDCMIHPGGAENHRQVKHPAQQENQAVTPGQSF
jgi:Mn2+/Fe2+ NRAMP family transporter